MKGEDLLQKMELADPAFVMEADEKPKKKVISIAAWAAVACLCLVLGLALHSGLRQTPDVSTAPPDSTAEEYGFCINDDGTKIYFPLSYEERRIYGLLDAEGQMLRAYESDLGELMGRVSDCHNENLLGCKVYHYNKFPELESICVLESGSGYSFYCCSYLWVEVEEGQSAEEFLQAYGLPESMVKMEVCAPDGTYLYAIEDERDIAAVWEVLSGSVNMGHENSERSFARAWFEAYGTDEVSYDEEQGHCVFRGGSELSEKAHGLWTEGEYIIRVSTAQGFSQSFDFFPAVGLYVAGNGYYGLSGEDIEALNEILAR